MSEEKKVTHRKFKGVVVSSKMDKTAVVQVESFKLHPKYKKRYKVSKKYKVHDENNICKVGDKIEFIECKPMSKDKRWSVVIK
ncbi:MAG: 30S ribosomal protein S17 [Patescibacteria group bacterium]|jgi:small subunit ribosomal protein S17